MKNTFHTTTIFRALIYGTLICTIFVVACKKSESRPTTDLSGNYIITVTKSVDLPEAGKRATLTFVNAVDQRCPINANCVWAGFAQATLKFRDGKINEEFDLCLGDCNVKEKIITSGGIKYSFSLTEFIPYPHFGYTLSSIPPTITVLIKRAN